MVRDDFGVAGNIDVVDVVKRNGACQKVVVEFERLQIRQIKNRGGDGSHDLVRAKGKGCKRIKGSKQRRGGTRDLVVGKVDSKSVNDIKVGNDKIAVVADEGRDSTRDLVTVQEEGLQTDQLPDAFGDGTRELVIAKVKNLKIPQTPDLVEQGARERVLGHPKVAHLSQDLEFGGKFAGQVVQGCLHRRQYVYVEPLE